MHTTPTVPVDSNYQKYLRFIWKSQLFQFTCLPNGLSSGPRVFTKLTKPLFSHLRKKGHLNVGYIDDSFLTGDTVSDCRANVIDTAKLSAELGFVIHPVKTVFEPTQTLTYLGFILNLISMTVYLTPEKASQIGSKCKDLLKKATLSIRELAELVGRMVGSFPGVEYGRLYYRRLDNEKSAALALSRGNFEATIVLSDSARDDITWWIDNVHSAYKPVSHGNPSVTLQSDACLTGWGGVHGTESTGGNWSDSEAQFHINYLELLAAWLTLKTFCSDMNNVHIQLQLDNTAAVAYVNGQGGRKKLQCFSTQNLGMVHK